MHLERFMRSGDDGDADVPTSRPPWSSRRRRAGIAVATASWLCLATLALYWFLLAACGDRWWFATVLLYAPRWPSGIPLLALAPLALWLSRGSLIPLAAGTLVFLWPVMGLCLPYASISASATPRLRVLSFNAQGGAASIEDLADLVRTYEPDVVALQERDRGREAVWPEGWHVLCDGEFLIASRYQLRDPRRFICAHLQLPWPAKDALRCIVQTPGEDIAFCTVHLYSPRIGLEEVLNPLTIADPARSLTLRTETVWRRRESEDLTAWIDGFDGPTIVAGDFNLPTDSTIYQSCWSSFTNAFNVAGLGFGSTKICQTRWAAYGLRIDHVLFSATRYACRRCWIGPDIGSDHRPLLADIDILAPR